MLWNRIANAIALQGRGRGEDRAALGDVQIRDENKVGPNWRRLTNNWMPTSARSAQPVSKRHLSPGQNLAFPAPGGCLGVPALLPPQSANTRNGKSSGGRTLPSFSSGDSLMAREKAQSRLGKRHFGPPPPNFFPLRLIYNLQPTKPGLESNPSLRKRAQTRGKKSSLPNSLSRLRWFVPECDPRQ